MSEAVATKKTHKLRWLWISLAAIIGVVLAAYVGLAIFFHYHYGFNTVIDGSDVSLKQPSDAHRAIEAHVADYSLQVKARQNAPVILTGTQIDLNYVADTQADDILSSQNIFAWPARLFEPQQPYRTDASISFDEQRLKAVIANWPFLDQKNMKAPVDATMAFQAPNYVVVGEDPGTTLDPDKVFSALVVSINALQSDLDLEAVDCYKQPAVRNDNPELLQQIDLYNRYVPFSITYLFGEEKEVLDGRVAINWVDTSVEPTGELNYDAVAAWVADYAARHDTVGKERKITNGFGEEKIVNGDVGWDYWYGGSYGWLIDQAAEIEAILAAVHNHLGEEREPYYLQRAASHGPQDWGDTYLELDISAQHMWFFKNGELVVESDVVSGQPINGRDTPTGVFFVIHKGSPQRMKSDGWAGVAPYDETANYFVGFTTAGHGFHDGLWRNAFGGSIWTYNGSHGCINMPLAPAETLYKNIEYDTPVVTHM
jgi:hypothetical protein